MTIPHKQQQRKLMRVSSAWHAPSHSLPSVQHMPVSQQGPYHSSSRQKQHQRSTKRSINTTTATCCFLPFFLQTRNNCSKVVGAPGHSKDNTKPPCIVINGSNARAAAGKWGHIPNPGQAAAHADSYQRQCSTQASYDILQQQRARLHTDSATAAAAACTVHFCTRVTNQHGSSQHSHTYTAIQRQYTAPSRQG